MLKNDLSGKYALVCGSSQGIGLSTALVLAQAGANLILMARNEHILQSLITELPCNAEQNHRYLVADFLKPEQVEKTVSHFISEGNHVDILINNTGGPAAGPILEAKPESFLEAFHQHLVCNQILAQQVVPGMKKERWGRIINVISTSVKQPLKNLGVSNTIRAAVANWAKTLSFELAPYGITVNNVLPGATRTERLKGLIKNKSVKTGASIDEIEHEMREEIPMHRFAEPEEIAYAVTFLASPFPSYITGINLPVDGGRTLCL